jgi:hypothetical protein
MLLKAGLGRLSLRQTPFVARHGWGPGVLGCRHWSTRSAAAAAAGRSRLFNPQPQRGGTGLNSGSDDDGFDTDEWAALARVLGDASPGDSDDESNGDGGGAWSDADLDVEDAALDPWADDDMDLPDEPPRTRAEAKQQMYAELEAAYGPHYAASDVRLYVKRRQHNAARRRPAQRGGFPMNDALPREATFGKLGGRFRDVVRECKRGQASITNLGLVGSLGRR